MRDTPLNTNTGERERGCSTEKSWKEEKEKKKECQRMDVREMGVHSHTHTDAAVDTENDIYIPDCFASRAFLLTHCASFA